MKLFSRAWIFLKITGKPKDLGVVFATAIAGGLLKRKSFFRGEGSRQTIQEMEIVIRGGGPEAQPDSCNV